MTIDCGSWSCRAGLTTMAVLLSVAAHPAAATTYYVSSSTGRDDAAGTSMATAWRTLERVGRVVLRPGDVLLFRRDDRWQGHLELQGSGTPSAPVFVGGWGTGEPPLLEERADWTGGVIRLVERDWVTIHDLDVRGAHHAIACEGCDHLIVEDSRLGRGSFAAAVYATHGPTRPASRGGIVRRNIIDSGERRADHQCCDEGAYEGVRLTNGPREWDIHDNRFVDWSHAAVSIGSNDDRYPSRDNRVRDNEITAPDISYGRAILLNGNGPGRCSGNEMYGNTISNTSVRSQIGGDHNRFYRNVIDGMLRSTRLSGNISQGVVLEPGYNGKGWCRDNVVECNMIRGTPHAGIGIQGYGEAAKRMTGLVVRDNLIVDCGGADNGGMALDVVGRVPTVTLTGNVFVGNRKANTTVRLRATSWWLATPVPTMPAIRDRLTGNRISRTAGTRRRPPCGPDGGDPEGWFSSD